MASQRIRYLREQARRHVQRGGSLALILDRAELQGVRCGRLLRWMPYVGVTKADSWLHTIGVPAHSRLSELTPAERRRFATLIRNREHDRYHEGAA
jgi:hypothetical protein